MGKNFQDFGEDSGLNINTQDILELNLTMLTNTEKSKWVHFGTLGLFL